ncbi:hypothetical protein M758_10G003600 [Ceratodon purpureus]|nr:hypothetical protein KC19_10G004200 [Ceratodon purpureus]KAG0602275.1 hypothetical protein M758_10G003600 [Ceratodon purpureus]KAG0602276.1 hypothetical protein M758_10G003600 [Ceratodon purpureus]
MGIGWAYELGPFHIRENGTGLETNIQSWNRYANVLFLESPTGVGFSYSNDPNENQFGGDNRTAEDSYTFLVRWLERFPEYKDRDFYITGESYAGHYVPQLAALIHSRNKDAEQKINLKGIMVGNPSTDNYYDGVGQLDYLLSHAVISPQTHDQLTKVCNYSDPNCCSQACDDEFNYAQQVEIGGIDSYSIDSPTCSVDASGNPLRRKLSEKGQARKMKQTTPFQHMKAAYDPCTINDIDADMYFNRKDVQKALHANVSGEIPYNWTSCSNDLRFTDSAFSVLPQYKELIAGGYKIWVYSGDNDAVVPVTGTIYALESLDLPVKVPWYAWYQKSQVGGRSQWYEGVTFVTVRGAGHEVPLNQPGRFLSIFKFFILGQELPGDPYV